jgi:glutathione S-transferase
MKLYTFDPAPNPQRLKMFMDFKGIDIDTQQVNFPEGEQRTDAYKALVPSGTVPALILDNGQVLTSVFAITQYLEAIHHKSPCSVSQMKNAPLFWIGITDCLTTFFARQVMH